MYVRTGNFLFFSCLKEDSTHNQRMLTNSFLVFDPLNFVGFEQDSFKTSGLRVFSYTDVTVRERLQRSLLRGNGKSRRPLRTERNRKNPKVYVVRLETKVEEYK